MERRTMIQTPLSPDPLQALEMLATQVANYRRAIRAGGRLDLREVRQIAQNASTLADLTARAVGSPTDDN